MMRALHALLLLWLFAAAAGAEERITQFSSAVTINADGALDVVETIALISEGDGIKRGILRDFPTKYRDRQDRSVEVGFTVQSVQRDGRAEPYALEDIANDVRIKIGSRDIFLSNGPHVYVIAYRTTKQLGFFDGFDELYWNVTGNLWTFPIDHAEVAITLPAGATVIQHAAYTGPEGAQGRDFKTQVAEGGLYRAETTKRLLPGEGFTVAVGFTKGIVPEPPKPPDTTWQSIRAIAGAIAALFGYYMITWFAVGRDPPARAIIPLFAPPPGLSPAGVREVWHKSFDHKSFGAAMIGLAAKGFLKIRGGDAYAVEKIKRQPDGLSDGERTLYLRVPDGITRVHHTNGAKLINMRDGLSDGVEREIGGAIYHRNRWWFALGIILSLVALIPALYYLTPDDMVGGFTITVIFGSAWLGLAWLLYVDARAFFRFKLIGKIFTFIVFALLAPIFVAVSLMPIDMLKGAESLALPGFALGLAIIIAMHFLFFRWLGAYTEHGRRLMDQVEGFRMYLATAEEDRLNVMNPPEKTPELFEKFLPYALALDCENLWSEKFAGVLAAAAISGPSYYAGNGWNASRMSDFSRDLDNSRFAPSSSSHSTSSSSYSPGSSSGSSGGGSSGGGGGGGGGGSGW